MSTGSHARIPQHMISLYSENLVYYNGISFHSKQATCKYNTVKNVNMKHTVKKEKHKYDQCFSYCISDSMVFYMLYKSLFFIQMS